MNYIDSAHLVARSPYLELISPSGAMRFIDIFYQLVNDYEDNLREYPVSKYEQLEGVYFTIQNIGIADEKLINDFLHLGYRGVCWAAWLITLKPEVVFLSKVQEFTRVCDKNNKWIAELAIAAILKAEHPYMSKVKRIRELTISLPREEINIRKAASTEDARIIEKEKGRLRSYYKTEGTEAALKYLDETRLLYFYQDYGSWCKYRKKFNKAM